MLLFYSIEVGSVLVFIIAPCLTVRASDDHEYHVNLCTYNSGKLQRDYNGER